MNRSIDALVLSLTVRTGNYRPTHLIRVLLGMLLIGIDVGSGLLIAQGLGGSVTTSTERTSEETGTSSEEAGWVDLFQDNSFAGWVRTNTPQQTWQFKDDLLICSGKPIGEIRTKKMYQNFVLELEWRHLVPGGNAGIFVWADDITSRGVPFHRGIEVQVLENAYGNTQSHTTHGDIFPIHGATMVPVNGRGGSRAFPTENRSNASPEWNHYRIECLDGEISLAVNGKVVTRGKQCLPSRGYLCLESEGGVVHYRNVRIQELPDTNIPEDRIAISDRGYSSIYSGLGFDGWEVGAGGKWKSNDWILSYQGTSEESGSIKSTMVSSNQGFLLDFRLKDPVSTVAISGVFDREVSLVGSGFLSALSKRGQWNRLEVRFEEGHVGIHLNGSEIKPAQDWPKGTVGDEATLEIKAVGSVEFANLYVQSREPVVD